MALPMPMARSPEVGSVVRFTIGDVVIGEAPGQSVITPVDLVSNSDASHPTVINIVCFLLTLDEDGNPDNGIQISEAVRNMAQGKLIDFAQSTSAFAASGSIQTVVSEFTAVTVAGARTLVAESYAQTHLSSTVWGIYAGSYNGTFSGDDSGSFSVTTLPDGSVTGTGTFDSVGTFSVSGQLATSGTFIFAMDGTSTVTSFTGTIDLDGTITGIWKNAGATGAFTGQRSSTGSGGDVGGSTSSPYGSVTITGDGSYAGIFFAPDTGSDYGIGGVYGGLAIWSEGLLMLSANFKTISYYYGKDISFENIYSVTYSCQSGIYGSNGDCSGVSNDVGTRTVTFLNVELQAPGLGDVILLNGALKY